MRIESDEHGYLYFVTPSGEKRYILVDVFKAETMECSTDAAILHRNSRSHRQVATLR